MLADAIEDRQEEEADGHTDTRGETRKRLPSRLGLRTCRPKIDECLKDDVREHSIRGLLILTFATKGPISCEVSPATLNIPPDQNSLFSTSFRAMAMDASFFPSPNCQALTLSCVLGPLPETALIVQITFNRNGGETSPFSSRAFHSSAALQRRAHASSNLSVRRDASRERSIFHKSVACNARWYPSVMMGESHWYVSTLRRLAVARGIVLASSRDVGAGSGLSRGSHI
jgi:hypothetical protein